MFQRICVFLTVAMSVVTVSLWAQTPCPSFTFVAVNSDEDHLIMAVNGADGPQDQVIALDKYAQDHPDSKFMPCVNEYEAAAHLKLKDYDKSIDFAEKDLAANYQDLNLMLNLMRAYAASTKVSDTIFAVINKVPDQAKTEVAAVTRPTKASDEEWAKMQKDGEELAKDSHDYAVWAFFQVIPRVTDPAKRIQVLDTFLATYPDVEPANTAQVDTIYFQTYQMQGNLSKTVEYGDKVIAADTNNVSALNTVGLIYAFYMNPPSPDKGATYAQKALAATQSRKKPDGVDDAAFQKDQNLQMGMAHLTMGYAALLRSQKTMKILPAINELKLAAPLLADNPALQGQALYFLANAYEMGTPANHRAALDALTKAVSLPGPMQGQASALLAKVKAAVNK
jgi:tetratricopeptide (TPR) repeat protein